MNKTDRLQGHLELLILHVLACDSMHGWAIAQRLQVVSRSVLQVGQGSIYPALRRLEDRLKRLEQQRGPPPPAKP